MKIFGPLEVKIWPQFKVRGQRYFLTIFLKIKFINIIFKLFWFQKYIVCLHLKNIWPQKKTQKKRFWEWPQNDLTLYLKNYWSESSTIRIIGFSDQNNPIYQMPSRSEIWGLTTPVGLSWNWPFTFVFTLIKLTHLPLHLLLHSTLHLLLNLKYGG